MHVFIITQYFPPEIGASASRWGDYAEILIKQNHMQLFVNLNSWTVYGSIREVERMNVTTSLTSSGLAG